MFQNQSPASFLSKAYLCRSCNTLFLQQKDLQTHKCKNKEGSSSSSCSSSSSSCKQSATKAIYGSTSDHDEGQDTLEELLISAVFARPAIWDHRLSVVERSRTVKDKLWVEIYEMVGKVATIDVLQKKWKNLRDKFVKVKGEMEVYEHSGKEYTEKKTLWKHYDQLQFLTDTITPRKTKTNLTIDVLSPSGSVECEGSSKETSSPNEVTSNAKRKCRRKDDNNIDEAILKVLQAPAPTLPLVQPDIYKGNLTCMRIAELLNTLPTSEKHKIEIEMLNMVYGAVAKYEN